MTATTRRGGEPPEIETVDEILRKMRAGVDEVHEIRLREMRFQIRCLSQDEFNQIRRDAKIETDANGGDDTDKNVRIQKMVLIRASAVKPGTPGKITDKLLSRLNADEMEFLYNEYVRVMDNMNPNIEAMTVDQFRMIVDALKKKTITSKDLSLPQLREVCAAFVDLIERMENQQSQMAKSSGGPQQTSQ
jgi:hypothetical protein